MSKRNNLLLLGLFIISISCNKSNKEIATTPISVDSLALISDNQNSEIHYNTEYTNTDIKKIDSKKELRANDGNFNQMTLFEVKKDISLEQLKNYCSSVKPNYTDGYFQILVFFKEPNSAKFPDNPVTGMYMEDEDLKNIKATYTINNINGYSKLDYYEKNNWKSLAQTFDIY
ncbi:hypothetical protein [Chryseobacterium sp. ERMR1:04]|uniref:hypothetical protein n=1 Tax=Chryseobacterium sp. ERMR1:04 TaxID=1705393 RepID=UPI0006C85650|nr:hypothetical protein [Chryseobacterium sp. ERMR1:04]KPH10855.1 hypothetical protein AMQ68_23620 [Chryseobacterium sp. ERMR1:04]